MSDVIENVVAPASVITNVVLTPKKTSPFIHGCEPTAREYNEGVAYNEGQSAAFRSKASAYGKSKGWTTVTRTIKDDKDVITGVLVQFIEKPKPTETPKSTETEKAMV